jgi:CheY-like chemotaxis protein
VLAHELRNPLAPLRTGLELIRLAGDTPGAVESVRTMMEAEVTHMVRLIDDLLDVSRITSGKIRLQRQPTPLGALVKTAIEFNRAALDEARVSLRVDIPEIPIVLDVDPTRFVQVLSNVIHNAVKFTDEGGQISIAAVLPETDGRAVREVSLVVTDSGIGISSHMLPRVFDLFTQGDATTHRANGGLGIGLALARQLIEMHGGSIEGHSDGPGRGSTFTIRMPLATAADGLPSATRSNLPAGVGRNVVVIDDNVNAARALQRLVTALGGRCAVAYDGESGLASIRESNPDVVLLDIGMPGIDGYEVCRRIRSDMGPGVFVVAMTGWGQERDKLQAMRAGFDLHLTKPADPNVLESLLLGQKPTATTS